MKKLRFRIGCWLIEPEAARLYRHYRKAVEEQTALGHKEQAQNCEYIAIGIRYASGGYKKG